MPENMSNKKSTNNNYKAKEFEIYSDKIIHITIADEKKYAIANALILNK